LESWINVPLELLTSKALRPRDIVMYGLLKQMNLRRKVGGKVTYRFLSEFAQVCVKTARLAVKTLSKADWLNTRQRNQMASIEIAIDSPSAKYCREQIALTDMRLKRPSGHGEAIALSLVTLAAEPAEYQANTKFSFLPSPDTGEMMEVDIWLPQYNLAVEYQGEQHFHTTPFASAEDVIKQQRRDAAKAAMLKDRGIKVVELTAADLSVTAVIKKLQGLVPLRNLRFYKRLVVYLNNVGRCYLRKAQRSQGLEA
jgi:hypothetical protein